MCGSRCFNWHHLIHLWFTWMVQIASASWSLEIQPPESEYVLFCWPSWSDKVNAVKVVVGKTHTSFLNLSITHVYTWHVYTHPLNTIYFFIKWPHKTALFAGMHMALRTGQLLTNSHFNPPPPFSLTHTHIHANPQRHFTITLCDNTLSFHSPHHVRMHIC